ncbi:hypothetical protein [uncultured Pseudomonas sp.]|uniref:hypothetical protein n=1 Tax=uncultured Pseudomonas sp. TaxID=114707 RepID=UPI0025D308CE|nr:hypothetical protein [uncultured Pseudomonas sp.]
MKITEASDPRPEEPTLSELIELARREREALAKRGGKGSARMKLEQHRDDLKKMLIDEQLPVAVIRDLLARTGTEVNLKSLFKFLREEMADEYADYLRITHRGKRENRSQSVKPDMSPAEAGSVQRFLTDAGNPKEQEKQPLGAGEQNEEVTATKPALTDEKKPPMRIRGQLRAGADRIDLDDYSD